MSEPINLCDQIQSVIEIGRINNIEASKVAAEIMWLIHPVNSVSVGNLSTTQFMRNTAPNNQQ